MTRAIDRERIQRARVQVAQINFARDMHRRASYGFKTKATICTIPAHHRPTIRYNYDGTIKQPREVAAE